MIPRGVNAPPSSTLPNHLINLSAAVNPVGVVARANAYSDILAVRPALEYLIAKISAFYRLLIVELLIPSLALN
jgi:hypothetical protein